MSAPRGIPWRGWPGLAPAAAGLGAGLAVAPDLLVRSGLAGLLVASAVGAGLAVPAAFAEWRAPAREDALERGLAEVSGVASALVVGALAAPLAGSYLTTALVVAWLAAAAVARQRLGRWVTPAALALTLAVACGDAALALTTGPWTALAPAWRHGAEVAPQAGVVGACLLAPGAWSGAPALPGPRRAPWLALGLAVGGALLASIGAAGRYEAGGDVAIAPAVRWAAVFAGATTFAERPWRVVAAGAWFAGPAAAAAGAWSAVGLLAGPLAGSAATARRGAGWARWGPLAGVGACLVAAIAAFPGFATQGEAAAVAVTAVALVWAGGLAAQREAA